MDPLPKFYMAITGWIGVFWMVAVHSSLQLNARKDYFLVRQWMILMNEWPGKCGENYVAVGLGEEANKKFWLTENRVNRAWFRGLNLVLAAGCVVFCSQQFFIPFPDVDWTTYALLQSVHIVANSIAIYGYLHTLYTVNLFYLQVMRFLTKKFDYLSVQCERLGRPRTDKISDRKLGHLIDQYTRVEWELATQNNFWKSYLGSNVFSYFGVGVLVGRLIFTFKF